MLHLGLQDLEEGVMLSSKLEQSYLETKKIKPLQSCKQRDLL